MTSRFARRGNAYTWLAWAGVLLTAHAAQGQDGGFEDARAKLMELRGRGAWHEAIEEAAAIEKSLKPKGKDASYIPRMKTIADIAVYRGYAARHLGDLDAATQAYAAAIKAIQDKDLQRLVTLALRAAGDEAATQRLPLDLTSLEVFDGAVDVAIDRLETLATADASDAAACQRALELVARVGQLSALAATVRDRIAEPFDAGAGSARESPAARALVGGMRSPLVASRLAFAKSLLHWDLDAAAAEDGGQPALTPARRRDLQRKAEEGITAAATLVDQAITQALPDDPLPEPPEDRAACSAAQLEAATLRADVDLLAARIALAAGEPNEAVAAGRRAVAWRRVAVPADHPDLFPTLVVTAEAEAARAEAANQARQAALGRVALDAAATLADEARALLSTCGGDIAEQMPERLKLERLPQGAIGDETTPVVAPTDSLQDAIDAAAGRARRALDRLSPAGGR